MALYATTTTLEIRMVSVQFDTQTTALAVEMCADAEAEVNKWLSKRYDISSATFQTSTSLPPMCRALATRLAEGYMWQALSRGAPESLSRAKALIDRVMENLKDIANYNAALVSTSGGLIVESSNTAYRVKSTTSNYVPTFDEGNPQQWRVDPNRINDIDDEKS